MGSAVQKAIPHSSNPTHCFIISFCMGRKTEKTHTKTISKNNFKKNRKTKQFQKNEKKQTISKITEISKTNNFKNRAGAEK